MAVYIFNMTWAIVMATIAVRYAKGVYNNVLKKEKILPNAFFVWLILISFMSFYALRWETGTDFVNYYSFYFTYGNTSISELIGTRDWGFKVLTSVVYKIWPDNFIFYNYILAALTYIPVVLTFRKYSNNFIFTIVLYITMLTYYWPYNGVRQSIACSICFCAYPFLYDKKYFKYVLYVLVAYLFHSTALFLLPFMFILNRKSWSKFIVFSLTLLSVSFIFLSSIWDKVIHFLEIIGQEKMANDYRVYDYSDDGANILRIAVVMLPILISFIFYKPLKRNNQNIDLLINMSLMCGVFMLFASSVTLLGRLSNYFIFFNALLIPEFTGLFKGKDKSLFQVITVVLFFIYMCMLLPVDSDLLPYRFIFNR
ncbi:EpsG family protein [Peribacillus frigoritolerans]|uniref:EpsG family protein n=1 Tax=Peribacillus castrilensis TaxID=2897690 RepID=UPI00296ECC44|nr:EpsG family protein [Peribacillus castrilensis]